MNATKHGALFDTLKNEILSGKYRSNLPFPSVRALINRFKLSDRTVRHALDELVHQGLISRKQGRGTFVTNNATSRKIGLIVPGVACTDFFQPIVSEINQLARQNDYTLLFAEVFSMDRDERIHQVRELAAEFIKKRVAGVIYEPLAEPNGAEANEHILSVFKRARIPVVLIDCDIVPFPQRSDYDVVGVNDVEAGAKIANHLLSVGAKKIHFLISKLCPTTFLNRLYGAEAELIRAGKFKKGSVLYAEPEDLAALKRHIRKHGKPDAFVCSNDPNAAVFCKTLEKAGLSVPKDMLLTGFADMPIASLMTPSLTTIRQSRDQMGGAAFRRLLERIGRPDSPANEIFFPAPLVVRESTARSKKSPLKVKARIATLASSFLFAIIAFVCGANVKYEANWRSLDSRPVPKWWQEAKFGIFVHWGPYSVSAYSPMAGDDDYANYAEWYAGQLMRTNAEVVAYHKRLYGDVPYANLAVQFRAENFDPGKWATLFKKSGARYAVLTSKHHDGYALWPSPESPYYNSVALGSGRDLCGEFVAAMRKEGLKCGFYYSLLEHGNARYPLKVRFVPAWGKDALSMKEWALTMNHPQLKELAERYHADILWPDGDWDWPSDDQCSEEFLAWLFNESSVRETVVVNDRWGNGCRGRHGGHYTTEYGGGADIDSAQAKVLAHPWEECRGIGKSFGFNRMETASDYMTRRQCIETLIDVVSRGGNLLLNVGPTADGRIPAIMQDRLLALGRWLQKNGEAVYGTTKGDVADEVLRENGLAFTRKGNLLYMFVVHWPKATVRIPVSREIRKINVLADRWEPDWSCTDGLLRIELPGEPLGYDDGEGICVIRMEEFE